MKKLFILISAVMLLICFCSCGDVAEETDENIIASIYEENNGTPNSEKQFNHKNIISSDLEYSADPEAPLTKVFTIDGCELEAQYKDTVYYPVGEQRLDRYLVDGDEEKSVLVTRDGNISCILYDFAKITISSKATPEEVLPLLKEQLSKTFDIQAYENVNFDTVTNVVSPFGVYDFLFYNIVNGYIKNYILVSVLDSGEIFALKKFGVNESVLNDYCATQNIDSANVEKLLENKLKDIYSTDTTEYISYDNSSHPRLTVYNGELCARYSVTVTYSSKTQDEAHSHINAILIPLRLTAE